MEIESEASITKQIKMAEVAEQNCEYLTVVRRVMGYGNEQLPTLKKYVSQLGQTQLHPQSFYQVFIQIAYFMYSCKYNGLSPQINDNDVRVQQNIYVGNLKRFSIVILYRFNIERKATSYASIVHDLFNYLINEFYLKQYRKKFPDAKHDPIDTFIEQYSLIHQLASSVQSVNNQKDFFSFLQCTCLFREHSLLLKIKRNSILDLVQPKINQFKQFKKNDINQIKNYINIKQKLKKDLQELKKTQKKIQSNILDFFKLICSQNKEKYKLSMQEQQGNNSSNRFKIILKVNQETDQPFVDRIKKINQSIQNLGNEKLMPPAQETQVQGKRNSFVEYHIQYSSQKNSICVKLILSIMNASIETNDLLMFQSNALTFDTANVSVQVCEIKTHDKILNTAKKQKFIAFKGSSCFNSKEAPLEKILLLMDLTMISAKVYEPYLNPIRQPHVTSLDFQKMSTVYQKVQHYSSIFLRCAKRVYN